MTHKLFLADLDASLVFINYIPLKNWKGNRIIPREGLRTIKKFICKMHQSKNFGKNNCHEVWEGFIVGLNNMFKNDKLVIQIFELQEIFKYIERKLQGSPTSCC